MSKENNLYDFNTDLADVIRAKKGYPASQKINPQDFAEEIRNLDTFDLLDYILIGDDALTLNFDEYNDGVFYFFDIQLLNVDWAKINVSLIGKDSTEESFSWLLYDDDKVSLIIEPSFNRYSVVHGVVSNTANDTQEKFLGKVSIKIRISHEGTSSEELSLRGVYIPKKYFYYH